jgi:hypothetical protein
MTDLAHRLRESANATFYDPLKSELNEAASHIEKLEAELHNCFHRIEELQAALREIADCCTLPAQNDSEMREISRKALEGKDD